MRKLVGLVAVLVCCLMSSIPATAQKKAPGLKGSKAVAREQNTQADKERLTRIADEKQLRRFVEAGILVPLPNNLFVRIDPRLNEQYRYCRTQTRDFLNDFGRAHFLKFGESIVVNSAVRPITRQKALQKRNGNAASIVGPRRSSHPTGSTVDIAKGGEVEWMRDFLRTMKAAGWIIVAEEFNQAVFHVFVSQDYGKPKVKAPVKKAPKTAPKAKAAPKKPPNPPAKKPASKPAPRKKK